MRIVVCALVCLFYQYTHAQSFDYSILFTTQNGLSNNNISCLEKDEDGFLWVGTHEGLNQYDGTEFVNVLSNRKNNLPSNSITKICSINRTTLAIATSGGLCFLNTKTYEGKKIAPPDDKSEGPDPYIAWDILFDRTANELWVATAGGIYVLSGTGQLKRKFEPSAGNPRGIFAMNLFKDKYDNIFFLSHKPYGFYYPDFDKHILIPVEQRLQDFPLNKITGTSFRAASFIDNKIICCFSDQRNTGNKNIVAFYDNTKRRGIIDSFITVKAGNFSLYNAFAINDSAILVNAYFGEPKVLNTHSLQLVPAAYHPLWFTSWPDGINVKLLVDSENIWAATSKGLLQIPQYPGIFQTNAKLVDYINKIPYLISYNSGINYKNKFWLSCLGTGVFSFDFSTKNINRVFNKHTPLKFQRKIISNELVVTGDSLWLFSVYGPAHVNSKTLQLSYIHGLNKDSAFDDNANFPLKDKKENIWVSLPNGVSKYSPATNSFTNYVGRGGVFPVEKAYFKTEDGAGNIWFARQDTLVKFDIKSQTFSTVLLKKDGHPIRPVQALASDEEDNLYLHLNGTFAIYQISNGALELFTKQTGIVSTTINQILTDKNGNPWMATEGGLLYYNKKTKRFYSYTKADGLPDENVISLNFTDDSKTTIFLGFSKSYCLFNPENLLTRRNSSLQNRLTGVEMNGEAITLDQGKTYSYTDNNFSFFYTGINFKTGQQNSYAYMLEGLEQNWTYCGKKRQCSYINLPPGRYVFKMKSANQQGDWNDTPVSFSFRVSAPFWQTWWFRVMIAIFAVTIIYRFIKKRDEVKAKDHRVALQMSELKLTALQSQMNPHFIFNSLNSIQNYILQQKPVDAARYLSKFSKLIRRVLDQSFNNLTPLNEIKDTLSMYLELEAFRFSNEFEYSIQIDDPESINDVKLPPLLLQPYVENAIIHGLLPKEGNKKLLIHLFKRNNELHCIIEDNGIGRREQYIPGDHISRGQKLTTDMLTTMKELLNADARIIITDKVDTANHPAGTTVELIVPINS